MAPLKDEEEGTEGDDDDYYEEGEEEEEFEDEESIESDGPGAERRRKEALIRQKMIQAQLDKEVRIGSVTVPKHPAPPVSMNRTPRVIPPEYTQAPVPSTFERMAYSALGRCVTFFLTLLFFLVAVIGVAFWNSPAARSSGQAILLLVLAIFSILMLYAVIPIVAFFTGLMPAKSGVDWKPYYVIYRIGMIASVPALIFMYLGPAIRISFGVRDGEKGIPLDKLQYASKKYFEASDGYVALNLSKGILKTLTPRQHDTNVPRVSRFRDAEVRVDFEPYSDQQNPTIPPGVQEFYLFAPVFSTWHACQTRYRISTACLRTESVAGWAFATSDSLCTHLQMIGCTLAKPAMNPVYKCSSGSPIFGQQTKDPVMGLCGRSVMPPADEVIDELKAMLLLDGWPSYSLPNASMGWFDVRYDPCIAQPEACNASWAMYEKIALLFVGITIVCVIVTAALDYWTDRRIRQAKNFDDSCKQRTKTVF